MTNSFILPVVDPSSKKSPPNNVKFRKSMSWSIFDVELDLETAEISTHGEKCSLCANTTTQIFCQETDISLYKYSEIPSFLKGNPYVMSGYRVMLPGMSCLRSLLHWNNETVNIWSHLLGFFIFFIMMFVDNFYNIPSYNGSISDHIMCTLGLLCYQFCMLCSAGYHIFVCHSERASQRWLAIDLAGVCVGLIGCYLPAVHFAFYCLSIWRDIYLFIIISLCLIVLVVQLHPRWFSSSYWLLRIGIFCGLAGYGVIPTMHWVILNGGFNATIVQLFLHKVIIMYFIGFLALFFYLSKCPERCFPGKMDYVGHSHQCWHMAVVLAFCWWHSAGGDFMRYRMTNTCEF